MFLSFHIPSFSPLDLLFSSPPLLLSSPPALLPFLSHLPPLLHSFHQADENSEMWKNYLEHIDMIVVDGFFNSIHCSLRYLLSNTDKEKCDLPFLECKLELQAPDMIFIPTLDQVHRTFLRFDRAGIWYCMS